MNKLINVLAVAGYLGLIFFIASLLDLKHRVDFIIAAIVATCVLIWIYKTFLDEDTFELHMVILSAIGAGIFCAWASIINDYGWWGISGFIIVAIFSTTGLFKAMYFFVTGFSFNLIGKK